MWPIFTLQRSTQTEPCALDLDDMRSWKEAHIETGTYHLPSRSSAEHVSLSGCDCEYRRVIPPFAIASRYLDGEVCEAALY